MTVRLVSYSQTEDGKNLQEQIAYAARVSNPANQNSETRDDARLIRYLINHKHWSPFEMVSICLEIKTTRDIGRQILRHRSFSFQEFSQRYAKVSDEGVIREARLQDKKNRQNSIEVDDDTLKEWWEQKQADHFKETQRLYVSALDQGIAKEQARSILPEGITPSTMYMNGTARSWMHYIGQRSGHGTQKEHMDIARQCADAIEPVFPYIRNFVEGTTQ